MNWIKPSDELPKVGEDVLIWFHAEPESYARVAYFSTDGIWMGDQGETLHYRDVARITHWARIEPPTE
jgi:hypothetical protein